MEEGQNSVVVNPGEVTVAELIDYLLGLVKSKPQVVNLPVCIASDTEGNGFNYLLPLPYGVTLDPEGTPNPAVTLWPKG